MPHHLSVLFGNVSKSKSFAAFVPCQAVAGCSNPLPTYPWNFFFNTPPLVVPSYPSTYQPVWPDWAICPNPLHSKAIFVNCKNLWFPWWHHFWATFIDIWRFFLLVTLLPTYLGLNKSRKNGAGILDESSASFREKITASFIFAIVNRKATAFQIKWSIR